MSAQILARSIVLVLILGIAFPRTAIGQVSPPDYTCYIKYDHDAAGNRTAKYWYCCCGASTSGTDPDSVRTQKHTLASLELEDVSMQLQPNPATTRLTVTVDRALEEATIEVYDMNGHRMRAEALIGASMEIDLQGLSRGAYALRLTYGREMLIKQFIVQ